jgi:hypothetical protein
MAEFGGQESLAAAEAAVAEAQNACAAAAEESRLALAAKQESGLSAAEAQLALAQQSESAALARVRAAELRLRGSEEILQAALLRLEALKDPASLSVLPQPLVPLALDRASLLGEVQVSADGRTITGFADHGNILGLDRLRGRAHFFEWRATGHTFIGLTPETGLNCPGCTVRGTIMWGSNGMLHDHLGAIRDDRQFEGYVGQGVRGGMLVNLVDGRVCFMVRTEPGPWKKVADVALPRAEYRPKFSVGGGGSIEVLGVRRQL